MLKIARGAVPLLVSVAVLGPDVLPKASMAKVRQVGERRTPALVSTPVPVCSTLFVLPAPLSVIVSVPVLAPVVTGLKVVLIVQFPPPATEPPQVLVSAKSPLV